MSEFPAPMPPPQPGGANMGHGPSGPRASFWRRFGAAFADGVLVGVVGFIIRSAINSALGALVSVAIGVAYFGYLEGSSSGQTLGKRWLGIRVIDFNNGGPIGFGRAVIRYFGRWVSAIPCLLGYFWM